MTSLNQRGIARGAAAARLALGRRADDPRTSVSKDDDQDRDAPKVDDEGNYVDDQGNYVDEDGAPSEEPVKASADDDADHGSEEDAKHRATQRAVRAFGTRHVHTPAHADRGAAEARKLLGR